MLIDEDVRTAGERQARTTRNSSLTRSCDRAPRCEPVVSLEEQESPTCAAPDRPSKILLVQVWTLSSSPIPRLGLSVFFLFC